MNAPTRLAAFAAALGLAFGGAALAGAALDPTDEQPAGGHASEDDGHGAQSGAEALSGLAVSDHGYTLEIDRASYRAGETAPFTFRVTDEGGRALRDEYQLEHEKELHLIVVRRDTAVFEHIHPSRGEDGTWSIDLTLPDPGVYRAYADFKVAGERRTLATDLFVPGNFQPEALPTPEPTAEAVDIAGKPAGGLDVAIEAPGVRARRETMLVFAVTQSGQPFERLEPYLGAKGHLVALREGDLAYLHVHPTDDGMDMEGDGSTDMQMNDNEIMFAATFPTTGRYRLFLQFKTDGEIRTVSYTVEVPR